MRSGGKTVQCRVEHVDMQGDDVLEFIDAQVGKLR